jgi:hypothetical protein
MSSSGLVLPLAASSARAAHVTSYVPSPDDSSETDPPPSNNEPSQWVLAVRVAAMGLSFVCRWQSDDVPTGGVPTPTLARSATIDK